MATAPTSITALPTAPDPDSDESTFDSAAYAWAGALPAWTDQSNSLASNVYNNAVETAANAESAAANAAAVIGSLGAAIWVSGTTYAIGDVRYSPANQLIYRRKTAGAGSTDPSSDATNWAVIAVTLQWLTKTANYTAAAGDCVLCNTTSAAFTLTLPASPAANDMVRLADYAGTFSTNNLTVGRNAKPIMGLSEDMTISTANASITLTYIDATQGWRIL